MRLSAAQVDGSIKRPIKVLQFGGGNFLRAFTDWMIDELNETTDFNAGVAIVKPTSRGDYDDLRDQDGLYHVVLNGFKDGALVNETKLIQCVQQVIQPYTSWDAYLKLAEDSLLRFVISNTTESGILYNEKDTTDRGICPAEYPAKLVLWLYHRYQYFSGDESKACILLPLELIEDNGDELKRCLLLYCKHYNLEAGFISWLEHCIFCNTLVDRIVSGYSEKEADKIKEVAGLEDSLVVTGEYYHSWIIQSHQDISAELPVHKTRLNVKFVDDLAIHREIKVKILNGAHTSMVPIGYLMGIDTVIDGMRNPSLKSFIEEVITEEILPTIVYDKKELMHYCNDVLDRFSNPSLHHKLLDIALNSTSKYVTRLLPTLRGYVEREGQVPQRIVLALAALIRMYQGAWMEHPTPLRDAQERIDFFNNVWSEYGDDEEMLVTKILANQSIWGEDLNKIHGLTALTSKYISYMQSSFDPRLLTDLKNYKN